MPENLILIDGNRIFKLNYYNQKSRSDRRDQDFLLSQFQYCQVFVGVVFIIWFDIQFVITFLHFINTLILKLKNIFQNPLHQTHPSHKNKSRIISDFAFIIVVSFLIKTVLSPVQTVFVIWYSINLFWGERKSNLVKQGTSSKKSEKPWDNGLKIPRGKKKVCSDKYDL